MNWLDKIVDWLLMAWLGAVITLMTVPVLVFIVLLKLADWADEAWERIRRD